MLGADEVGTALPEGRIQHLAAAKCEIAHTPRCAFSAKKFKFDVLLIARERGERDKMSKSEMLLAPRVFLSYASEDVNWVRQFKKSFVDPLGDVVVVDFKDGSNLDFGPLGPWLDKMVDQASVIMAFVSRTYYSKVWTNAEWQRGLTKTQRGQLIFVPIMMDADAKVWWGQIRKKGELLALSYDYQYSDFTEEGRPTDLDKGATIAKISSLAANIRSFWEKIPPETATPGSNVPPEPDQGKQLANPPIDSQLIAAGDPDVILLGSPVGRFDVGLETQVDVAAEELRKHAMSPKRWGDGWRNDAAKRVLLRSPNQTPIFVQPLAPGEVDEPLAYAGKTTERLTATGAKHPRVTLWLPIGNDPAFDAAARSAEGDTFPALRTDTPQGLAAWLCDLVRPLVPADTVVLQIETIGFPDGSEPDNFTTRLADDLQQRFCGIVNQEIRPNPGLWPFWSDEIEEQVKMLPGNRAIIAVHDLDIAPSADFGAIRAALEVKLSVAQGAVERANREKAGTNTVDPFFTALLVKHAKALPFGNYPSNGRFKDWRLLRFEPAGVKPVPASLAVFRGQLHKWASGRGAVGVAA